MPTLDGARGIAALVVVVSHASNYGFLPHYLGEGFGRMGVSLFFVLSGFLMAYLYANEEFRSYAVARYAVHRTGRVVPLFLLIVLLSWLLHDNPVVALYDIPDADAAATHLLFIHGTDVLWTIPVEVQYYALFLLIWIAVGRRRVTLVVAGAALLGIVGTVLLLPVDPSATYLPFWLHFFLLGSVVALFFRRYADRVQALGTKSWASAVGWIVLLGSMVSMPELRRALGIPVLPAFRDPISAGIPIAFFLCSLAAVGPFRRFGSPVLRWLGAISYSVYLVHLIVIRTLEIHFRISTWPGMVAFAVVLAVTLLVASLLFHGFERPTQRLLNRLFARAVPSPHRPVSAGAAPAAGATDVG